MARNQALLNLSRGEFSRLHARFKNELEKPLLSRTVRILNDQYYSESWVRLSALLKE